MQDFKKLKVWEKSHQLTLDIYRTTMTFPDYELFGLASQLRRSAASIPSNIAEGCGRFSAKEMKQSLNIAMGSATETEYHLLLANQLNYFPNSEYNHLNAEIISIKQMLTSLMQKVSPNHHKEIPFVKSHDPSIDNNQSSNTDNRKLLTDDNQPKNENR